MKSLLHKTMFQLAIYIIVIMLLVTPLFYLLTKHYYAEDMIDIIEAAQQNLPLPELDLEEDIMQGVMIQFALISCVLGGAIILVTRFISKRLWEPYEKTLQQLEEFRLENGIIPPLAKSDIKEFTRLNLALNRLMENSLKSYQTQKEFTENASHELQTPLAVFQSKLDLLLQQPDLTEQQADIVQSLYEATNRLSRLNRNLLLLARIDNNQYKHVVRLDAVKILKDILPTMERLVEGITIHANLSSTPILVQANHSLLESLINNLIVNAIRHNTTSGEIFISMRERQLDVANTSTEGPLDEHLLFNRFYRPSEKVKGNGLGLAIAKAICEYHGWQIHYTYKEGLHLFTVHFDIQTAIPRSEHKPDNL